MEQSGKSYFSGLGAVLYRGLAVSLPFIVVLWGCGGNFADNAAEMVALKTCSPVTGTPWTPLIEGAGSSAHSSSISVSKTVLTGTGPLLGWEDPLLAASLVTVNIDMTQDLGAGGSLTLVAQATGFPGGLSGGAYPMLISLSDGTNEYVNLNKSGTGGYCGDSSLYNCSDTSCSLNGTCSIAWPSAFFDLTHWEQRQMGLGYVSSNTFPTCNWADGPDNVTDWSGCAFNKHYFVDGKLRSGVNYTAKYVIIASDYLEVSGYDVGLKVTALKKMNTAAANGAIDLNVFLVGAKNVAASRTPKGQQNLDLLFKSVFAHYNQVSIKIGSVRVVEWGCLEGGDLFAAADYYNYNAANYLGKMFAAGSGSLPAELESKALNLFLVSTIGDQTSNMSVVGLAGAISGPLVNGTGSSGVAIATFNKLDQFNPSCSPGATCELASQDSDFIDMGATISHEMGHYLGLNHPSERAGTTHDRVYDTPVCANKGPKGYLTINSCTADTTSFLPTGLSCLDVCPNRTTGTYCPAALECQYNHLMWWSTKTYTNGTGDGNLLTPHSGTIMKFNPFVQ
ncbi:MAG TPA: hypothetical protein VJB59_00865 [Bdellovibrionota bacterium]|nr:hypothetical protein [Bdellovibrionota bacterium]